MQRVVPAFRISSYSAALRFYQRLGFREKWTHRFDVDLPVFASIVCDGMEINLTEHIRRRGSRRNRTHHACKLIVICDAA